MEPHPGPAVPVMDDRSRLVEKVLHEHVGTNRDDLAAGSPQRHLYGKVVRAGACAGGVDDRDRTARSSPLAAPHFQRLLSPR